MWSVVYFPANRGLKTATSLTLLGTNLTPDSYSLEIDPSVNIFLPREQQASLVEEGHVYSGDEKLKICTVKTNSRFTVKNMFY